MDIKLFLKLINRYKWLLILVPVATVTVTYFLVQNLPKQYKSNVEISTGLLDPSKKVISDETVDFFKVSQQINSIIEKLQMKKSINMLSYNLILHDLEQPRKRFKKYSDKVDSLNYDQRKEVIALYKDKLASKSLLTLSDDTGKYKLYSIIESMGYGEDALRKKLDVSHADNSDFITIEYTSEDPDLSAYVVNTLASGFIADYMSDVNTNENTSIDLLDSLVKRKEAVMNQKNAELSAFKRSNGVLNLSEQASSVDAQITKYEGQKADLLLQIDQDQAALAVINNKLRGGDPDIAGSSRADNLELISIRNQLQTASNNYIDQPTAANRKKVDSLTTLLNNKRNQNSNENVVNPLLSKQNLLAQKNTLDVSLATAKGSFKQIDAELTALRAKFNSMVPYDADIQNKERDAELATKDYTTSLDSYNASKTNQNVSGFHLQIDQIGLPGNPEPSKRMIYLAGAGFGSFALSMGFLLVLFALDNSINNLRQLERATKSKTIGALNKINGAERHIRDIWNDKSGNENIEIFRDLLRALRFEIRSKMDADNKKILGITSLVSGEGKTFIAYGLAYAFAMTGKKILLITDVLPVVKPGSKELANSQDFEVFLVKKEIRTEDLITILNKSMVQSSLLETQSVKNLQTGFEVLKKEFDMIIIDINSLHNMNIAKEWLLFTEMNIAVFASGRTLDENDLALVNYIKNKPDFIGWIMNKMEFEKQK